MGSTQGKTAVYLEVGKKRTFAGAIEWPGWCRSGRDEMSALGALLECGPRYAKVIRSARLGFKTPSDATAFAVSERLKGDSTTEFGAPGQAPSADSRPVDAAELRRLQSVLKACWRTFDEAVTAARGTELAKGPRGGGRELDGIVEHVLNADAAYLARIGWKFKASDAGVPGDEMRRMRVEILKALAASAAGELPTKGPRGGAFWKPRYFVRRMAWHVLDHAWEIEDRIK